MGIKGCNPWMSVRSEFELTCNPWMSVRSEFELTCNPWMSVRSEFKPHHSLLIVLVGSWNELECDFHTKINQF